MELVRISFALRKIVAAARSRYSDSICVIFALVQRRTLMSRLLLARGRSRRCLRAAVLPLCVGLLLAALPATPLHAQPDNRIKAPDFDGAVGPTLGSDNPIRLKDLRGKIVVLEFWTLC
jgi:hypothetical protein